MNAAADKYKLLFRKIFYFFPLQLLFLHLKKNLLLLVYWLLLFGYTFSAFGTKYGIPYLFLGPEYLNQVDYKSFAILGFAFGGFVMAFQIASYIMNGFRFPFIATLARPFYKYSLNNSFIPFAYILLFLYHSAKFQHNSEQFSQIQITFNLLAFIVGYALNIIISLTYFITTNKNLSSINEQEIIKTRKSKVSRTHIDPMRIPLHKGIKWFNFSTRNQRYIETYLHTPFRISLARSMMHYDEQTLKKIFTQNHMNASLYQVVVILSLVVIGAFKEVPIFLLPAGASILLLFTLFIMISSALHSWIKGWSTFALIAGLALINYLSQFDFFNYQTKAYGLSYKEYDLSPYSEKRINEIAYDEYDNHNDYNNTLDILENWKKKFPENSKPKMIFINCSGGGMRSTLWTFHMLQYLDSMLNGQLMKHTQLISGSSGGMIGAAYFRELYLQKLKNSDFNLYHDSLKTNVAKDLLNPIIFTIATNDILLRLQSFNYHNETYIKDRAYAFEKQLLKNTNNIFEKKLSDYSLVEYKSQVPMMVFAPTIINESRRLLISAQPVSYLCRNQRNQANEGTVSDCIDFSHLLKKQEAGNVRFSSVLRMNATFPYILPSTHLPTYPSIQVMDAGMRDNFGISVCAKFIHTFRDWLIQHTGGVILINIRDTHKGAHSETNFSQRTIMQSLMSPLGSLYENIFVIQDYNNDDLLHYSGSWYPNHFNVLNLYLKNNPTDKISLSFHLTGKEKRQVISSVSLPENKATLDSLLLFLQNKTPE
ncbi:MAG: patatin-like phospholipase family protein [Flavobacteriales bacterium]|nr:patatin-like phospholipase family protein [Flavobacteriales bacterium]